MAWLAVGGKPRRVGRSLMAMSDPQPQISASTRSGRRWLLPVAIVVGVLVGGGAVGLTWALTSEPSEGPAADVSAACAAVERTPVLVPEDFASFRRWAAASELAASAAEVDKSYQPLADALAKPVHRYQSTFDAKDEEFRQAISAARQACANV